MVCMLGLADCGDERRAASHALSCGWGKTGASCPAPDIVLPPGLRLLGRDPDGHVRARAIELTGRFARSSTEAELALLRAREADRSAAVRTKAGWYAPGGTSCRRTAVTRRSSP
jgi:hypothetical protein